MQSAIDMVAGLARGGPSPLLPEFVDQFFPPLMHILWTVNDNEVLQSGQQCLKTFIGKDSAHLVQWRDQSGKSGLQYVVEFVANLLTPDHSESEALFVGDLIVKLIQKVITVNTDKYTNPFFFFFQWKILYLILHIFLFLLHRLETILDLYFPTF